MPPGTGAGDGGATYTHPWVHYARERSGTQRLSSLTHMGYLEQVSIGHKSFTIDRMLRCAQPPNTPPFRQRSHR